MAARGMFRFRCGRIGDRHKKVDLLAGRVVSLDPNAYVDVHTQTAVAPVITDANVLLPRIEASYPCVSASVGGGGAVASQLGSCALAGAAGGPVGIGLRRTCVMGAL